MKFKARQLSNGNWAVFKQGVRFWINTERPTEAEAEVQACIASAEWHQQKIDECRDRWEELQKAAGEPHQWQDWGNCLA